MALPATLNKNEIAGTSSAASIDDGVQTLIAALQDIIGIPNNTTISNAMASIVASGMMALHFRDAAAAPTTDGTLLYNGSVLQFYDGTTAQTVAFSADITAASGAYDFNGSTATLDQDGDLTLAFSSDDVFDLQQGGNSVFKVTSSSTAEDGIEIIPVASAASTTVVLTTAGNSAAIALDIQTKNSAAVMINGAVITTGGLGNVVEDTTPQLGGTLDSNSNNIDMGGNTRIDLDADNDTSIRSSADDLITFEIGGTDSWEFKDTTTTSKMTFDHANSADREITFPNATTTMVGTDVSQTLTNKTINADNNTCSNFNHGAEVDNPSSGVHGVTGNVVGTTDTQTLTNKSLTSASLTSPTIAGAASITSASFASITTASIVTLSVSTTLTTAASLTATGTLHGLLATGGGLYGLTLSNNGSDATNDIDVAVGAATSDDATATDRKLMVLATALTKQLDAGWAVGTNAGMLDTGLIDNVTYHIFLIMRSDTGNVDILASESPTSPTMPTNYDYKRRIGSILRESAAIVGFTQDEDLFQRDTGVLDINNTNPGTSSVTGTLSVPTGVNVEAVLNVILIASSGGQNTLLVSDPATDDVAPTLTSAPLPQLSTNAAANYNAGTRMQVRTNTSAQIRYRCSFSDASVVVRISTVGWFDRRGRSA